MIHHAASGDGPLGLRIGKLQTIHVPKFLANLPRPSMAGRGPQIPKAGRIRHHLQPAGGKKPVWGSEHGSHDIVEQKSKKTFTVKSDHPHPILLSHSNTGWCLLRKMTSWTPVPPKNETTRSPTVQWCSYLKDFKVHKSDSFALILRLLPMTLWRVGHLVLNSIALERANTCGLHVFLHIGKCQRVTNPF